MPLFNIFSNIWIYVSSNQINSKENKKQYNEYMYDISKIKQIHHISKTVNLDEYVSFWQDKTQFINEIQEQIIVNKQKKLIQIYDKICTMIQKYILSGDNLLIHSFDVHECCIGLYLYFLKKMGGMSLQKSRITILSKFTGLNINLSDDLKKLIYLVCK